MITFSICVSFALALLFGFALGTLLRRRSKIGSFTAVHRPDGIYATNIRWGWWARWRAATGAAPICYEIPIEPFSSIISAKMLSAERKRANRLHRRAQQAEGRGLRELHRQIRRLEDENFKATRYVRAENEQLQREINQTRDRIAELSQHRREEVTRAKEEIHMLRQLVVVLRKHGTQAQPKSENACGNCPQIIAGHEHDFCGVHEAQLKYDGKEHERLKTCRQRGSAA